MTESSAVFSKVNLQISEGAGFPEVLESDCGGESLPAGAEPVGTSPGRSGGALPLAAEDQDGEREGLTSRERALVKPMKQAKPLQENPNKQNPPKKSCFMTELQNVTYKNMFIAPSLSLVGRSQVAVFSLKIRFVAFSVLKVSTWS